MSAKLKNELFLSERRLVVTDMYFVKHVTQRQIAEELGVTEQTIRNDIKVILEEYSMKRLNKVDWYTKLELTKLDKMEAEAWEAWGRSIGKSVRLLKKRDGGGVLIEETETQEELLGDPRYLTIVHSCMDKRMRLLGLDKPKEFLIDTVEGRVIRLVRENKIDFDTLASEVGKDEARRYFNLAERDIPDIIEGEVIDDMLYIE
jgi:hypothetical protein